MMDGYWNRPEVNAQRMRDGWWHTTDAGRREADGSITFLGTLTRMIKSAAENIYPPEVESCLTSHPAVKQAAVIGVPDPQYTQSVKAVVVLEETSDAYGVVRAELTYALVLGDVGYRADSAIPHLERAERGYRLAGVDGTTDVLAVALALNGTAPVDDDGRRRLHARRTAHGP